MVLLVAALRSYTCIYHVKFRKLEELAINQCLLKSELVLLFMCNVYYESK